MFDVKLIFSSLSRRCCPNAYIHITEDPSVILLTNSITKVESEYKDTITEYNISDLSVHLIRILDGELLASLYSHLPSEGMYYIHTAEYLKGNYTVTPIVDTHVVRNLRYIASLKYPPVDNYITDDLSQLHYKDLTEKYTLYLDKYTHQDIHKDRTYSLQLIDGLASVSWKEFIPKVRRTKYTWNLYTWLEDNVCIKYMSYFANEYIQVKTYKPNMFVLTLL